MAGWSIVPAVNSQSGSTSGDEMKQYGQVSKLGQPDFYAKEEYKDTHADEDMLPGQKMYYLESQRGISQRENALRNTMMQYFSSSTNMPSSDMQRKWNQELGNIEQQKTMLNAQRSTFTRNFITANARTDELIKAGDKSTANRLALRYVNGTPVPILGPKEEGGHGWLTQLEEVKGFDYAPGQSGGMPVNTDLQTSINYTGDFNKFIDDKFKEVSKSKTITPQMVGIDKDGKPIYTPQSVSPLFGTKDVQYMSVMTQSNNLQNVQDAAENMMEFLPEPAKLDLAGKFYEKLLYAQQQKDGTISFKMDNDVGDLHFSGSESGTIIKMLNMQKLDRNDTARINDMITKYGKNLILSQVRPHVEAVTTLHDVKVKGEGAEKEGAIRGGFTQIATGQAPPTGQANISYKKGGSIHSNDPGILHDGSDTLVFNKWTVPLRDITDINNELPKMLVNMGGVLPSYFAKLPFFHSEDGMPNPMAILNESGARVVGITGEVQENLYPDTEKGKKGYELVLPDVSGISLDKLSSGKVNSIGMILAVPEGDPFFKNYKVIDRFDTKTGVDEDKYPWMGSEQVGGKNIKKKYRLVKIWMDALTTDKDIFFQLENKNHEKGTYQAQQEQQDMNQQREKSIWQQTVQASN
jgi:hypothetical protein